MFQYSNKQKKKTITSSEWKKTKQKKTNILNFKIKNKSTYKFFEQNNLKGFFGPVLKSRKRYKKSYSI